MNGAWVLENKTKQNQPYLIPVSLYTDGVAQGESCNLFETFFTSVKWEIF